MSRKTVGVMSFGSKHTRFHGQKPGEQIPGWLELINENRKSDLLEPN